MTAPLDFWSNAGALSSGVLVLWVLLGLVTGSAMNAIVHRLPKMLLTPDTAQDQTTASPQSDPACPPGLSLWWPRSHCPLCLHPLGWRQLIPVLSFLHQNGRCSFCKGAIASRYLWIEILSALWWCWCAWRFSQPLGPAGGLATGLGGFTGWGVVMGAGGLAGVTGTLWLQLGACALWSLLGSILIALAYIDWEHQLLPDALTATLLWGGLIASGSGLLSIELHASLWGAVLGYGSFAGVAGVCLAFTHREGLGQGDFKLLAALGAWLGPWSLIPIVLIASFSGLLLGLWQLKSHGLSALERPMPFGPFLVLGAFLTMVWGPQAWLRWL